MNTFENLIPSKEIEYQTPKLKEEDIIINVKDENLENLNINEEQKKNIQSETSEDYKSILSHRTYLSMNSKSEYTSIKENKLIDKKRKKINEVKKLKKQKCTRKTCKFKFLIKIPCGLIQIILEPGKQLKTAGKLSDANKDGKNGDRKGVYTFEYDISVNNQKKDKENEEIIEL